MRQSKLFPRTKKKAPSGAESVNHKLLVRAGFIDQLMAGSWSLLPLGWRVVDKINNIIREEMNAIGAQEVLMPLLHPKGVWNETGRWDKAHEVMYKLEDTRGREYALSFTHEEIFLDITRKHLNSYQDLPIALYHFSTKFRNELRARSGILRGREFMMKDLYSVHRDEDNFWQFYKKAKQAYKKIFNRIGFDILVTEAGGGVFTENKTHEYQVPAEGGEDTVYYCKDCGWGVNEEIFEGREGDGCPECGKGTVGRTNSIEVGNIFPFGTSYSEKMGVLYMDEGGSKKPAWFGSYGIGSTRVMGAWVEVSNDKDGIVWSPTIAPFGVHLIELSGGETAENLYRELKEKGIEVLWDDRDLGAGEKFAEADLLGIPVRLVVSKKTGRKLEWKERTSDKAVVLEKDTVIRRLNK